jgi:RsiW-degrading membrane proteinase PrsW (M82 family)
MFETIILLIISVAPALFLVVYYYKKDKAKPEPKELIIKSFLWGCFLVIPAIILELLASSMFELYSPGFVLLMIVINSFVIAGLIEEWLKRYAVLHTAYKSAFFDEVMDGILYTIVVSLGFAAVENIFYVLEGGYSVALMRAITAIPLHATASGIMGYYIGKAKFAPTPLEEVKLFRTGLKKAVLIHGFYNFTVYSASIYSEWIFAGVFVILIGGFIHLRKLIKLALAEDELMGRQGEALELLLLKELFNKQ